MIVIIGGRASGGEAYAKEHFPDRPILCGYEETVREQLQNGEDPLQKAEEKIKSLHPDTVVVLTEMGCGMVPAQKEERIYRDANGRVNCLFAEQAETVIRVLAGIGQVIR